MLLSLLGRVTSRAQALKLFGLPSRGSTYAGTDLQTLASTLSSATRRPCVWRFIERFHFDTVSRALARQLQRTRRPMLMWFGVVHRSMGIRARHVAIVMGADRNRIRLLDPLGRSPGPSLRPNVEIHATADAGGLLEASGSVYAVNPRMQVAILCWSGASRSAR